jgi:hypothetical protein
MASGLYIPDYLSAPLGGQPKKRRRAMNLDVPQIVAGLALLLAVFMLWMTIGDGPPAREPLRIAAKPVDPPATAPQAVAPPAIPPAPDNEAAPALPTNSKTITIINGKTGEKKEVVVFAPVLAVASPAAATPTPAMQSGTIDERDSKTTATTAPADRSIVGLDPSASLPGLPGAATIAAAPPSLSASDEVTPAVASLDGPTPLPRRRQAPFAMVQNAAMPTVVPLPRARPQVAPAPEPEPVSDTTAELMNDTSSGYEPGLSGHY